MTRILLVGDTHGDHSFARRVVELAEYSPASKPDLIFQLGDFAYKFAPTFLDVWTLAPCPVWFIRGNHDSTDWLRTHAGELHGTDRTEVHPNVWFVPDGHRFEFDGVRFVALGGAVSIDRSYRKAWVSWWPDETCAGLDRVAAMQRDSADVVLSHDVPDRVPELEDMLPRYIQDDESERHRMAIGRAVDHLRPSNVFHGHHHLRYSARRDGCDVMGLDANTGPLKWAVSYFDTADHVPKIPER